jgi:hypothetical protein
MTDTEKPTLAPLRGSGEMGATASVGRPIDATRAACLQAKAYVMALAAFDAMHLVEPERSERRDMAILFGQLPHLAQNAGFSAVVPWWWPDVIHPEPEPQTEAHLRRQAVRNRIQNILDEGDDPAG